MNGYGPFHPPNNGTIIIRNHGFGNHYCGFIASWNKIRNHQGRRLRSFFTHE